MPIDDLPDQVRLYLDEIADCLWSGNAVVMVGAGFSRNAKPVSSTCAAFPSWQELGDIFFEKLYGRCPSQSNARYLNVLKLADQVEASFRRSGLNKLLCKAIPDLMYEPSPLHSDLLDLPWEDVFTTNYDTLLERTRTCAILRYYSVVTKKEDLLHQNKPRIVKLHGSFPSHPFVITEEDYRRYPNDHAPFVNTVRQALLENTLCLIGFSGDDPNFLQWIGWIRDHIGSETTPNIYLVGAFDALDEASKKLLYRRGIVVVDMTATSVLRRNEEETLDETKHKKALKRFLKYLRNRKPDALEWPKVSADARPWTPNKYREITAEWRRQRGEYPGWVVVSKGQRHSLWSYTEDWLSHLSEMSAVARDQLRTPLDLDLAFELAWRLDRCLVPLIGELPSFLEDVAEKYSNPTLSLPGNTHWTRAMVFEAVANIRLWLLRHYRETGLTEKWQGIKNAMINEDLKSLPPELRAKFQLEEALQALFCFDPAEAKRLLVDNWQSNNSLPFWEAKRAALMAELGESAVARLILKASLSAIREQLGLNPVTDDYTLVSQESIVMLLRWVVERSGENDSNLFNEMSERWNALAQYKCDPRREIESLSARLQHPAVRWQLESQTHSFDLGRVTQTFHFNRFDEEALAAYNMLRMYEDIGMPYRIENTTFVQEVKSTLPRLRLYSPHLALVNIVRLGNAKAADELFDREYLAGLNRDEVDSLFKIYLPAFERTISMTNESDSLEAKTFKSLAETLPEVFSRLCYKCSSEYRRKLAEILLVIYKLNPEKRRMFTEIRQFAYRLFNSMSFKERLSLVPSLINSPVPDHLSEVERIRQEFVNPLVWINRAELPRGEEQPLMIQEERIDELFNQLTSSTQHHDWTMTLLAWLHEWGKLNEQQSERLGRMLWNSVEAPRVPAVIGYYSFECINKLPHPEDIDPQQRVKEHLRLMIYERMGGSRLDNVLEKFLEELEKSVEVVQWSKTEALEFVAQFLIWWHRHKHLLNHRDPGPFGPPAEHTKRTIRKIVHALSAIFLHLPDNSEEDTGPLREFLLELARHNIPTKVSDVAILSNVAEVREELLEQVKKALLENDRDIVIDALYAARVLARKLVNEESTGEFAPIAMILVQGVQWRHRPALAYRLLIVADLVKEQHWFLSLDVLAALLAGLEKIAEETSSGIRGNDEGGVITIRASAASLAFALSEYYQESGLGEPTEIQRWREICSDPNEFSEVKNSWLITSG